MASELSIKKGIAVILNTVKLMPSLPGIYKMLDHKGVVLYVGKAKKLPNRVVSYANIANLPARLKQMLSLLDKIEYLTTGTEAEALLLEAHLIKSLKPKYNISLKDDKSFPYIVIEDDHLFPRISKFRGNKNPKRSYFGPFAQAKNVNETIIELQKLFRVRPCTNNFFATRIRPCLQYQINRCSAPCVAKISKYEYAKLIQQAKDFLNGKNSEIQSKLIKEMESASHDLKYERAAEIRDRIKLLSQVQAKNIFKNHNFPDTDFIAVYKEGELSSIQVIFIRHGKNFGDKVYFPKHIEELSESEILELFMCQIYQQNPLPLMIVHSHHLEANSSLKQALKNITGINVKLTMPTTLALRQIMEFALNNAKEALEQHKKQQAKQNSNLEKIATLFGLDTFPSRIEVYDNSHIQGTNPIGCMVVAGTEGFIKNQYRKFHIKTTQEIGDDYQMLKEVLQRRLQKLTQDNYPDLLLIDGGKGHLNIAIETLVEAGLNDIKVACISKGSDRNAGKEFFHLKNQEPFQLNKNDPVLHYLQSLRDEAHRFAITSHRKLRIKKSIISKIDDIPGIGKARKRLLLNHFGSLERLKEASKEDIARIKGLNRKIAENINSYLRHN